MKKKCCGGGCMPGPKIHELSYNNPLDPKIWEEINRDAIIYGTAYIKMSLQNTDGMENWVMGSLLNNIKPLDLKKTKKRKKNG